MGGPSDETPLRQHRRADQRHRLGALQEADRERRLCGRADGRAPAGRSRRAGAGRQHGRGPARQPQGHGHLPQPDRRRARHRPRADHDRLVEMGGDRGRPEVRAGQGDRQLDLDEGGRGEVPRAGDQVPALRRGGGGDGLRRAGPGRHARPQGGDLRARLPPAHRAARLSARGHHLRPQHLRRGHRPRGAQQLRGRLHRGDAGDQADAAARPDLWRGLQHLIRLPRQRAGAPGDARGVPLPRDRRRHGHGHRQRRRAAGLRRDRSWLTRSGRGRDPEPSAGRHRAAGRHGAALQGRRSGREGRGRRLAFRHGGRSA